MTLEAGNKLGPYEIIEQAGAGGMGEVYKAKDSRLDRTVAIKILPESIAGMPDFKQRFDREARAISSLNHAHICTLHDVGHQNGYDFLVMEFLEGETLAARLSRGPLPYNEMLQVAIQIAGALDSAHRQGLIHRDLKPGNVMLTGEGAKLMDFGLAKLAANGGAMQGTTGITQTTPLTGAGTILGTMQYMAPEQLEGKEADGRSDIFAFGAILYEMTTGKRAFEGTSQATLIASIMGSEPTPISAILPATPPLFERLVKKCLEKDAQKRWQSAADLSDELRWISQAGSQVGLPARISRRRKFKFTVARIVGAVGIATSLSLGYLLFTQPEPVRNTRKFIISPSDESREIRSVDWSRISPDGQLLALRATDTLGVTMLWIRPMNSLEPYPLRGTEDIRRQFWSPDSKYMAFFKQGQLFKIPVAGGPEQLICDVEGSDGSWGSKGYILFDNAASDTIKFVAASGGVAQYATYIDSAKGERSSAWPWFLSDGIHFLYVCYTATGAQLRVGSIESDESTLIFDEDIMSKIDSRVEFCRQGYLLFVKDRIMMAQGFDESEFKLIGEPVPVAQGINRPGNTSIFGTSDNGVLIYHYKTNPGRYELAWYDRNGKEIEKVGEVDAYRGIELSPDNTKLAFGLYDESNSNTDLWIRDLTRNQVARLTFDKPDNFNPVWSPDGKYIAYSEPQKDGSFKTKYKRSDGQGVTHALQISDSVSNLPLQWFSDSIMYLETQSTETGSDIYRFDFSDSSLTPIINSSRGDFGGSVSKNGKYILYVSYESGNNQIYVSELGGDHGRWQISNDGGLNPTWRSDDKEIFYRSFDRNELMSVEVNMSGNSFEVGQPKSLFRDPSGVGPYCPTRDGQKFIRQVSTQARSNDNIIVVLNWIDELQHE